MLKRIGMVLANKFPPDIRVEKEAKALIGAGFEVHLLCGPQSGKPHEERVGGVRVRRARVTESGTLQNKLANLVILSTFRSRAWEREIAAFAKDFSIDALHVHDMYLANTSLEAMKGTGIPVILDFHENYPAAQQAYQGEKVDFQAKVIRLFNGYPRLTRLEGRVCGRAAGIVAVVEEMKERLLATHPIPPDKVTVVTNTEDAEFVRSAKVHRDIVERYQDQFTLLYIGGFGYHRGLDTAIEGMARLKGRIPGLKLLLVGRGSDYVVEHMKSLVNRHGLEQAVEFVGWQPFDRVFSYMHAATIGLVPHHSNEHTDNTIPHKLYQYMMVGKPCLVSTCKPLARVVKDARAGEVFQAGDSADFAAKVLSLFQDREGRERMGHSGKMATLEGSLNWQATGKVLTDMYSRLLGSPQPAPVGSFAA